MSKLNEISERMVCVLSKNSVSPRCHLSQIISLQNLINLPDSESTNTIPPNLIGRTNVQRWTKSSKEQNDSLLNIHHRFLSYWYSISREKNKPRERKSLSRAI